MFYDRPWTFDRALRLLIGCVLAAAAFWLVSTLSNVLIPFAIAFLGAYILDPLVKKAERRLRSRSLAVFSVLFVLLVTGCSAIWLIYPLLRAETEHAAALIRRAISDSGISAQMAVWMPGGLWQWIREQLSLIHWPDLVNDMSVWRTLAGSLGTVLPGAFSLLSGTWNLILWVLGLSVIILYLVFLLLDFDHFLNETRNLLPPAYREQILGFLKEFDNAMSRYFRAQTLVAALVGVLFALGFSTIGLPLAILFGLFVGLLNMVPYLQIASLPIAALLAILQALDTGSSVAQNLALTFSVYVIVQIIQDVILVPRIMGNMTGLSPVMILLSISVWGKLLGFFGLIIAIPFTCLILVYYRRILNRQETHHETPSSDHRPA